jgi:hypothetical protein
MTEAVINLRYLAESQPSLCIPRVFNNITEARIRQVFDDLGLGKISRIDIKERKSEKGDSFKRVYVHFDKWFWNEDAQAARRKLVSGKEIKIVYDNPWFWKVSASKWEPTTSVQDKSYPQRSRAHIDFGDSVDQKHHNRVTDEFGRDLRFKNEYEDCNRQVRRDEIHRHEPRRYNDSREQHYRTDNRRQEVSKDHRNDNRRRDDSRERRRPDNRSSDYKYEKRNPIVPTLTRKAEYPVTQKSTTPCSSPPRISEVDNPDTITAQYMVKIDYGNAVPPPPRRKTGGETKKPILELVEQAPNNLEEGEVVENKKIVYTELSEEDRKECDELYGDIFND